MNSKERLSLFIRGALKGAGMVDPNEQAGFLIGIAVSILRADGASLDDVRELIRVVLEPEPPKGSPSESLLIALAPALGCSRD